MQSLIEALVPVGLSLMDVQADGTIRWVMIPDEPADRALSPQQAAALLLLPAYVHLRGLRARAGE